MSTRLFIAVALLLVALLGALSLQSAAFNKSSSAKPSLQSAKPPVQDFPVKNYTHIVTYIDWLLA
jgi:hypothetical protein